MPGRFRHFDHLIEVAKAEGTADGMSSELTVERADDNLSDAWPMLQRARQGLLRKTSDGVSRNIFLVIHMFDRLAVETPIMGPALAPLDLEQDVDTVWVL